MLRFLPAPLKGALNALALALNTILWAIMIFAMAIVKLLLPFKAARKPVDRILQTLASNWITGNGIWMHLTQKTRWQVSGVDDLQAKGWYLVNCNHQSWVDIFVLQRVFNGRIPFLKFFLKQELIYVPVMGLAWWALDFPFMKRHSAAYLAKHPEKRLEDQETTRKACAKFALIPTSVMSFAEGTRFTPGKHRHQQSPYRHLLRPKVGALALALNAMGERFQALIDVTIVYPEGVPNFWQFMCGKVDRVVVHVKSRPIPANLIGRDYGADAEFRTSIQQWANEMWDEKDRLITELHEEKEALPV